MGKLFHWSNQRKHDMRPKLQSNCGGPPGYKWNGGDSDDWVPTDAELIGIEERKLAARRKLDECHRERNDYSFDSVEIMVIHMPISTDVLDAKLAYEDRQEDSYGSSYSRNHYEHLICNFPGYDY